MFINFYQDNEQRKKQEERAAKLEAEKSAVNATIKPTSKKMGKQRIFKEDDTDLVDILMYEIKAGNFKLRRSLPSGNGWMKALIRLNNQWLIQRFKKNS